jgi:hypothetical protein
MAHPACKACRHYKPMYYQVGRCQQQENSYSAKMWTEDGKSPILVHATFGCNQFEEHPPVQEETI